MMEEQKTRYILLRDNRRWHEAIVTNLQTDADGDLALARVPGLTEGAVDLPEPFDLGASGLAVDDCQRLYIADTDGSRVICKDRLCEAHIVVPSGHGPNQSPGHFRQPCGLLVIRPGGLYVADSGNGRVQVFRLPTLEVHAIWEGPLHTPIALAYDSQARIYVVDRGLRQVLRFSPWGIPDEAYNSAMAAHSELASPRFLAIDADDVLYVADDVQNLVLRFDQDGNQRPVLPAPEEPFHPRALVGYGDRLYIADAKGGHIWVYDRAAGHFLGKVAAYRGPVTALAIDAAGTLFIKPGPDQDFYDLQAETAFVSSGQLETGPLDAGEGAVWRRAVVEAEVPAGTDIQLQLFATNDPAAVPADGDWEPAQALDTLVPSPAVSGNGQSQQQRYLWLRLLLTSDDGRVSPRLLQVKAETLGETYLSYLPAIYQRDAHLRDFLDRWLALFQAELGDLELALDDMPRRFNPQTTPEDHLGWLAAWLAFELPPDRDAEDQRSLLLEVHELYQRRGTPFGVGEFVHRYTGVRPRIFEAFQERRLWQLGYTSALGFDTGLAPLQPQGIVVPEGTPPTCPAGGPKTGAEPEGLVVGSVVVGQSGPLAVDNLGEPLFSDTAHLFSVMVPANQVPGPRQRQAVRDVIEAEKPAHTDYHLCFVEARMRVGFQARIGIDSIIAGPPEPMALDGVALGLGSTLGAGEGEGGIRRVGRQTRLGRNLIIK